MRLRRICFTLCFLFTLLLTSFGQEPTLLEHGGGVRTVEFSPIDASLVVSAGESNIIKLWHLQNNTVRTLVGHTSRINSVAFSPNGELLASVSDDGTLKLWNVDTQQNIATLREETLFRSVAFSPDGQLLATGGGMHVKLWDVRRRAEIATLRHDQQVQTVSFSSDGQLLAAGDASREGSGTVKVWDVKSRRVVATLADDLVVVRSVTFSSDDRYLASSHYNGEVKVWNVSDWQRLYTIPQAGDYDIAFSPDGKMIAGTGNGYVSILWAEEGTRAVRLPGPTGWMHPVDFSHDSTTLAVGAEDGIIRIWHIDTSSVNEGEEDTVRILHIDTYLQQLPKANAVNRDTIADPVPPPAVVRAFFELDPFYEQWINVGGLPVLASAKVNPYALKEAAWLIRKMIGHRPDVLRAMVGNKARFSVIAHTEIITEIPEYRSDPRPDFLVFRERGWGGTEGGTISTSEEDILNYPDAFAIRYEALLHELAHGVHILGLNTLDPTFDERLEITYEAAMSRGLWQGTYAASDRREYWAEASHAWFHPKGAGSFDRFGDTRRALKQYDPSLATLLAEVYGEKDWQYTPVETRTHQPHLHGFNPKESPTFDGWPELAALYRQVRTDPSSDGGGKWVNLKQYSPNQLSRLAKLSVPEGTTTMVFVNFTQADVLLYEVTSAGTQRYWSRCAPGHTRVRPTQINKIWLIKALDGRNMAVFQAVAQIGRAAIGAAAGNKNSTTQSTPPKSMEDVSRNDSDPHVLIAESQHPPMYWVDTKAGTLHRLVGTKVENLAPNVKNATSLTVDGAGGKLYWTEKTGDRTGRIRGANLDGTHVKLVKNLTSVPHSIAIDAANGKLYLTNAWGKVQRLDIDGSNFQPNFITNLNAPKHITLDVADSKVYWTETEQQDGRIQRANLDGSSVQNVATGLAEPTSLAVAGGKIYWTERTTENAGKLQHANLDGTNSEVLETLSIAPTSIAVDPVPNSLYLTLPSGEIHRRNLDGSGDQPVVTNLGSPSNIVLGISATDPVPTDTPTPPAEPVVDTTADVNQDQKINKTDLLLVVTALGESPPANPNFDVNADGTVNIADVLLVIEALDDPVAAAAPSFGETRTALDPGRLARQIDILRAESDGSLKYEHAIVFFQSLLASIRPTQTQLLANYPNPFNPETWIPYELATDTNVKLTIYNTQGVVIRTLALGHQRTGYYTGRERAAYWDGRNALGEQVASGIYFYQLETDEMSTLRKMVILK